MLRKTIIKECQRMLGIMVGVPKRVLKDARKDIKLQTFVCTSLKFVGKQ